MEKSVGTNVVTAHRTWATLSLQQNCKPLRQSLAWGSLAAMIPPGIVDKSSAVPKAVIDESQAYM